MCCRAENGFPSDPSKAAPKWGSLSKCDIPRKTFEQFLNFTASNFDIDMIIWTGDNIAHDIWQQSAENQTLPTYDITQDILKYFPDTFVYPMFGKKVDCFLFNLFKETTRLSPAINLTPVAMAQLG